MFLAYSNVDPDDRPIIYLRLGAAKHNTTRMPIAKDGTGFPSQPAAENMDTTFHKALNQSCQLVGIRMTLTHSRVAPDENGWCRDKGYAVLPRILQHRTYLAKQNGSYL